MKKLRYLRGSVLKFSTSLLFILPLWVMLLTSCDVSSIPQVPIDRQQLELEKLALEVSQLRQEQQLFGWSRTLSIAGSFLASIAILWTIGQGYQTLRSQTVNQKQSRIAEILSSLSSENEMSRIGAARSLSRYPNETIDEILSALRFEKSNIVREALEDTLEKISDEYFFRLLAANTKTLEERASLLGCLSALQTSQVYSIALLRLSAHSAESLRQNRDYRFRYDHGLQSQSYEQKLLQLLGEPFYKNNDRILLACQQSTNLAISTSKVIARLLRSGHKLGTKPLNLDLTASNLYRVDLHNACLPNSLFTRSIMRHIDLSSSQLSYSDFSDCNLYEADLNHADLSHCSLVSANLLDVAAERASFQYSDITETGFSRSNLNYADFRYCTGKDAKIKGINAIQVNFEDCHLEAAHFDGSALTKSSLLNARLFRATWKDSNIIDSNLEGIKLNGANLTGTKFLGSNLLNADLSGADIRKADFRGAKNMTTVKLQGVKNAEMALFDDDFLNSRAQLASI